MSRERLEQSLERLRRELDGLPNGESRDKLRAVIDDVDRQVQALGRENDDVSSLLATVRHQIDVFEVEHPRVTGILNDLMVTLGNMGI